jgi:hypothetical protein
MKTNRKQKSKFLMLGVMILLIGLASSSASAEPLFFSNLVVLQNGGNSSLDLYSNQGVVLTDTQLTFQVDITGTLGPNQTDTLQIIYLEQGGSPIVQSFQVPLFGSIQPPFSLIFSVTPINPTPQGTAATLSLNFLNSSPDFIIPSGPNAGQSVDSQTYAFKVAEPIPEPGAIVLLGTGMVALAGRFRRKWLG